MAAALASARPLIPGGAPPLAIKPASVRRAILWLFVASGCIGSIEPSPYEFMFVLTALAYAWNGLAFDRAFIPMLLCLALFEAGGLLSLAPFVAESVSVSFVATSIYVALTAIFFAALVARDPLERMRTIRSGYVAAGVIAAALGVLAYFKVAGLGPYFTLYDNERVTGPFKDPNVFAPFLVPPIVWLAQDLLLKRGAGIFRLSALGVMLLGLFLSFSRGAWGALAASLALLVLLTFATAQSAAMRQRIARLSVVGLFALVAMLALILSVGSVREMFDSRAALGQYYDVGELGRFGAQLRSLPMLLERPFGFGPLQFNNFFPQAPHEVYINAFSAYGWLGGLAFVAFTAATLYVGTRLVFQRTPFQGDAIAVWSCLAVQMAQGFQIDTDHWRHLYLLFGVLYGLAAASRLHAARQARGLSAAPS